jgi:hypothetical protein
VRCGAKFQGRYVRAHRASMHARTRPLRNTCAPTYLSTRPPTRRRACTRSAHSSCTCTRRTQLVRSRARSSKHRSFGHSSLHAPTLVRRTGCLAALVLRTTWPFDSHRSGDSSLGLCVMEALFWVFSFGGMPGAQVIAPTAVALLALMSQSQRAGADCQSSAVVAGQDLVELAHLWCGLFRKRPRSPLLTVGRNRRRKS